MILMCLEVPALKGYCLYSFKCRNFMLASVPLIRVVQNSFMLNVRVVTVASSNILISFKFSL